MNYSAQPGDVAFADQARQERQRFLSCLGKSGVPSGQLDAIGKAYPLEMQEQWTVPSYEGLACAAGRNDGDYHPDIMDGIMAFEEPFQPKPISMPLPPVYPRDRYVLWV